MERYHKTAGDPPRRDIDGKLQQAEELGSLVLQFLARGGQIEQVGHKMSDKPAGFVINPMTTPVHNGALATDQPIKAKPDVKCVVATVPPPSEPATVQVPAEPSLDKRAWLVGMLKAQALVTEQISKLARESGISDAELRRLARRHGVGVVFYGAR